MRPERTAPPIGRLPSGVTLDLAAATTCAAVLYGGFVEVGCRPAVCLLLAVPAALPVPLWRRHDPVTVLGAMLVIPAVTVAVAGSLVSWLFLPAAFALCLVATRSRPRTSVVTVCAVLAVLAADGLVIRLRGRPASAETVSIAMMLVIAWGIGHLLRQRRTAIAHQRARAAERAAAEERLRIAREMHDVLAHSMSVIAVQASFGHYVIGSRPDEAATALGLIETTSREALAEMRDLLGVLRQRETGPGDPVQRPGDGEKADGAPLGPAPGLAELDHLLARTADAGVEAGVEVRGEPRTLSPGLELSIHRIVQEALTNVVKHSTAERCRIVLEYRQDELVLDITDDGRAEPAGAPAGHGLIGMRERVDLHRGRFSAGPRPEGGFQVTARIPLRDGPR
jgi:signal transduction histidine kinase